MGNRQIQNERDDLKQISQITNCHLDYLTISDIAYTLWQYFNSYDNWFHKMENGNPGNLKYKCKTKYTTNIERIESAWGGGGEEVGGQW